MVAIGLVAASASMAVAQDDAACRFDAAGRGRVTKVEDARDFVLDDGSEVRLAAIEAPAIDTSAHDNMHGGSAARAALAALITGQTVELRQQGGAAKPDRYGRTIAHVYGTGNGTSRSVGEALVAEGFARVGAHVGDPGCAAEFLSLERLARARKLGLWADPYYDIVPAGSWVELLARRGRFTVVEGKVQSVRESRGITYVNFGRRWSQALTVTIWKRHERIFRQAGLQPKTLENRRIRVRGFIEERNGPQIEAETPEQIEVTLD